MSFLLTPKAGDAPHKDIGHTCYGTNVMGPAELVRQFEAISEYTLK